MYITFLIRMGLISRSCFDFCLTPAKRFPSPLVERGQRGEAVFRYSEACFGVVYCYLHKKPNPQGG